MSRIKYIRSSKTNLLQIIIIVSIALFLVFFSIAVDLASEIYLFLTAYTGASLTRVLINLILVIELVLLLFAYRRWFTSYCREKELSMIIDSISPDGLIVVDKKNEILLCNRSVERMFGYKNDEVVGQNSDILFSEVIPEEESQDEIESLRKEGFYVGLAKGKRKDGAVFPIEVITGNFRNEDGAAILLRDVTERVDFKDKLFVYQNHLEELVRERTAQLQKTKESLEREVEEHLVAKEEVLKLSQFLQGVIDNARIWMEVLDTDANVVLWNRAAEEISGYSRDEVLGSDAAFRWIYPKGDDAVRIKNNIVDAMKNSEEFEDIEAAIVARDGRRKIISWSSRNLKDSEGVVSGVLFLGREITSEKASEERAKKRLEEMKFLSERAMNFVEIRSEDRLFEFVAKSLKELVGESTVVINSMDSESSEFSIRLIIGEDKPYKLLKDFGIDPMTSRFRLDGKSARESMLSGRLSLVEGGLFELSFHVIPKAAATAIEKRLNIGKVYAIGFSWGGHLFGSASIIMKKGEDIENSEIIETFVHQASVAFQRSSAEKRLVEAKLEAERANRAKTRFLANMSHEIRTPLNGMLGMTEVALRSELELEQRANLRMAYESGRKLLRIVNDILDLSKIEAGEMQLVHEEFSLRRTVNSIRNNMIALAKKKGLRFIVNIPSNVPDRLVGDSFRLEQVLRNLVSNAIKFTDEGEVRIRIERDTENRALEANKVVLRFSVKDTGVGIPKDKQALIFEDYQQADSSTKYKKGTGLGIAIAESIVILMGGNIHVKSELGAGSDFYFSVGFELADHKEG